jgi:hypothetical protein
MVQWDTVVSPDQDTGPGTATRVRAGKVHNLPFAQGTSRNQRRVGKRSPERLKCQRATRSAARQARAQITRARRHTHDFDVRDLCSCGRRYVYLVPQSRI